MITEDLTIGNDHLNFRYDKNISWGAKEMLAYLLLSDSQDESICFNQIKEYSASKDKQTAKYFKELTNAHYIRIV